MNDQRFPHRVAVGKARYAACGVSNAEQQMARHWYCTNICHIVRCLHCRREIGKCSDSDILEKNQQCCHKANPLNEEMDRDEYRGEKPRNADFDALYKRVSSFYHFWPMRIAGPYADCLAKAGFYTDGPAKECICFACGLSLDLWENLTNDTDKTSPIVQHALYSPACQYLHSFVGKRWISDAIKTFTSPVSRYGIEPKMTMLIRAHSYGDCNWEEGEMTFAVYDERIYTYEEFLEKLTKFRAKGEVDPSLQDSPVPEETETLQNILECKVCLTNRVTVAFRPCAHLVCAFCSRQLVTCPLCRKSIKKKLYLYF